MKYSRFKSSVLDLYFWLSFLAIRFEHTVFHISISYVRRVGTKIQHKFLLIQLYIILSYFELELKLDDD
jgi:hypothetical protein